MGEPKTFSMKLYNFSDIDDIGSQRVMGETDCGFETFSEVGNIPRSMALQKLKYFAEGSRLDIK